MVFCLATRIARRKSWHLPLAPGICSVIVGNSCVLEEYMQSTNGSISCGKTTPSFPPTPFRRTCWRAYYAQRSMKGRAVRR